MPTYVYACDTCQVQFEKFQSFNDEPLRTCPTCQSAVRRVLQPAGIVFKGSGWHITDYRAQQGGESSSSATSATASSPSTGESKPAGEAPAAAPSAAESAAPAPSTGTDTSAS